MRSHIRLFIPLVVVLVFCIFSFNSPAALTQSHTTRPSAGMLRSAKAEDRTNDPLCGGKIAQQTDAMAIFGAPGGAFDSGAYDLLLASKIEGPKMFAPPPPPHYERVETIEATSHADEFMFVGLPDDDLFTKFLSLLSPAGQTFTVHVGGSDGVSFEPADLTINVGDTVQWVWDSPNHTTTSGTNCTSNGQFNSSGPTFSRTFNTAGNVLYYCNFHCNSFNMAGQITVQGTASTFTISGKVTNGGNPLSGVTISLSGAQTATATTNASGVYSFANLASGNYTVTPSHANYTFTPESRSYTNLSANQTNQNFAATPTSSSFSISGFVKVGTNGLSGVTMTLTSPTPAGFTPRTATTASTGGYSFTGVPGGRNYKLTPSKTGYTFKNTSNAAQSFRTYTNLSANQANQNFAATANGFTISGVVKVGTTGLAGVTMKLVSTTAGFTPRTLMTTNTGGFSFTGVPGGRNYTLTPSKSGFTFNPVNRTYMNLSANQTNQNFAATAKTYTISGRVKQAGTTTGIAAVTMTLSSPAPAGFSPRTVQTNSTGAFSFVNVPAARNYTLKPTKTGFTFNPVSRSYTNLSANQTGAAVSFEGTPTAPKPSSTVEFTEASYLVKEGDGHVEITVARSGDVSTPATVDYEVSDGTASDRSDYSTTLGSLRFAAGETSKSFIIFITDDAYQEGDETMTLTLGNETNGVEAGNQSVSVLTITDNDTDASAANPIDDPAFFVRQLYVDFLAREPRTDELAVLVNRLNQCVAEDIACNRAEVSASFLRLEEFRQRGYFVYRLYKASLGRAPSYREFIRDMRQVEGANGDALAASQEAFLDEWMRRSEFADKYGALSDKDYVESLLRMAGMSLADNDGMLGKLERGSHTRSQVLREMIESAEPARKLDESASVTMLYFVYFRRNPDAEDINTLIELMNHDPQANRKVVQALINSAEYRSRFGQP